MNITHLSLLLTASSLICLATRRLGKNILINLNEDDSTLIQQVVSKQPHKFANTSIKIIDKDNKKVTIHRLDDENRCGLDGNRCRLWFVSLFVRCFGGSCVCHLFAWWCVCLFGSFVWEPS